MLSELLNAHLTSLRARHITVAVFTGIALAAALIVLWTGIAMWIDWTVTRGLPRWGRALSLVLELAVAFYLIARYIINPILHAPDDEEIALMVEREYPDFRSRMIASVQLTRKEAQAELVAANKARSLVTVMVRQAEELVHQLPLSEVIKTKTLNKFLVTAGTLVTLAVFLFLLNLPASGALLSRAFLANTALPTKTHIESITGEKTVAIGDPITIHAKVTGYKPSTGILEITFKNAARTQKFLMDRDHASDGTYSFTIESVQESFTYSVVIYDGASDDFHITALERPAVAAFECTQVFPAYTARDPEPCPSGELLLLRGGTLRVKVLATKELRPNPSTAADTRINYIQLFGNTEAASQKIPLYRDNKNKKQLYGEIPLSDNLSALSIHLVDINNLESRDTAVYPVEMLPDRPPTVKIVIPDRKEVLQTAVAKFEVGFIAEDDNLLGKLTLRYKLTDDENGSIHSTPLQLPPKRKELHASYLWDLAKVAPPPNQPSLEGSVIEYWLDVEDTRPPELGGPGQGTSEHFAIRVVTAAAKQAELLARSGETVSDIKTAEENQNANADKTVTFIKEIPNTPPTPSTPNN
ncbi:MAG: hypothetical protein FWD61_13085 [Phycisphaerales bacterium]|nr:hypothetical protein [Phycisphaerales bacterium]